MLCLKLRAVFSKRVFELQVVLSLHLKFLKNVRNFLLNKSAGKHIVSKWLLMRTVLCSTLCVQLSKAPIASKIQCRLNYARCHMVYTANFWLCINPIPRLESHAQGYTSLQHWNLLFAVQQSHLSWLCQCLHKLVCVQQELCDDRLLEGVISFVPGLLDAFFCFHLIFG